MTLSSKNNDKLKRFHRNVKINRRSLKNACDKLFVSHPNLSGDVQAFGCIKYFELTNSFYKKLSHMHPLIAQVLGLRNSRFYERLASGLHSLLFALIRGLDIQASQPLAPG